MRLSEKISLTDEVHCNMELLLKVKGITLQELADKAGVSLDTVKRLRFKHNPNIPNRVERRVVMKVAEALGVWPSDIVTPEIWWNFDVRWGVTEKHNLQRLRKEAQPTSKERAQGKKQIEGITQKELQNRAKFSESEYSAHDALRT
jgi:transcriptional regulator with XRE-family HTH domain